MDIGGRAGSRSEKSVDIQQFQSGSVVRFSARQKEDNWLISPAIEFNEAGTYRLDVNGSFYGTMDFAIGNDKEDLAAFRTVHSISDASEYDSQLQIPFTIEVPGQYHVGFHAKAASGSHGLPNRIRESEGRQTRAFAYHRHQSNG